VTRGDSLLRGVVSLKRMSALRATPFILLLTVASACASSQHQRVVYRGPVKFNPLRLRGPERAAVLRSLAVGSVQSSPGRQGLRIFPSGRGIFLSGRQTRACRIPGAVANLIEGICQTRVTLKSRSLSGGAIVTFIESWPARKFRTHGPPKGTLHHSWRYLVRTRGGTPVVRLLGSEGAMPPQAGD
jgi:hypothetical protein